MGVRLLCWVVVVVMMAGVSQAGPVPDMTRLVRENEIKEKLAQIDTLMNKVINKTNCIQRPKVRTSTTTKAPSAENTTPADECDYRSLSPTHTMLLTAKDDCQIFKKGLNTPEEKELILELHNNMRSKVARGEETKGKPGPQPPAANMRELVWSDKLAQVAQAWANQCPNGHDKGKDRGVCGDSYPVGQNIHYYWGYAEEPNWKFGVEQWYKEVKDVPKTLASAFKVLGGPPIGHYTQVVFAETQEVGCGVVYYEIEKDGTWFPASKTYVCNYGTAGNVVGRPLYIEGLAASKCTNGVSPTYSDLCA